MNEDKADGVGTIEYTTESERYRARFEAPPSLATIEMIATISGEDPLELDPLYEWIAPDALDQLFSLPTPPQREGDLRLTFQYAGYEVTINSYGVITAEPSADGQAEHT